MVFIKELDQFMDQSMNLLQSDPVKVINSITDYSFLDQNRHKNKTKGKFNHNYGHKQQKGNPTEVIPNIKPLMNAMLQKMTNRKDNKTYVAPNTQSSGQGGAPGKKKNKNKGKGKK